MSETVWFSVGILIGANVGFVVACFFLGLGKDI